MKKKSKVPILKEDIILIVEGNSDYKFIERLKSLYTNKFNIEVQNAKSGTKIIKKYKDSKKIHPEKRTIVLYDLDNKTTVEEIKTTYKYNGLKLDSSNLYFINPKIEFLFTLWHEKRAYTIVTDEQYQQLIKKVYGIENYDKKCGTINENNEDYYNRKSGINTRVLKTIKIKS